MGPAELRLQDGRRPHGLRPHSTEVVSGFACSGTRIHSPSALAALGRPLRGPRCVERFARYAPERAGWCAGAGFADGSGMEAAVVEPTTSLERARDAVAREAWPEAY